MNAPTLKRAAILISGGGSNMVTLARDMLGLDGGGAHPARPVLVLSNVPDAGGLTRAADLGIETAVVDHRDFKGDRPGFEAAMTLQLERVNPDVIILAGFMRILTDGFINRWAGKMLNIHPSLLPKYKGLHTHARALEAGDSVAGCSVHEVTAELDGGRVLGQAVVPIAPGETEATLAAKVLVQEHRLYPLVTRRFLAGQTGLITLDTTSAV